MYREYDEELKKEAKKSFATEEEFLDEFYGKEDPELDEQDYLSS